MKYVITVAYDGSGFYGFQKLNGYRTVQAELEKALSIINKEKMKVVGAGRTDRGVHAYGQRASFNLKYAIPPKRLLKALNDLTPGDINISFCKTVADDFHARYSVKRKWYQYRLNVGSYDPLKQKYYYQINYPLDITKMRKCLKYLKGIHYFNNFVAGSRINYQAIIYKLKIAQVNDNIIIDFVGKSFYRYMVRNLVGALVDVGRGIATVDDVKDMIDNYELPKKLACAPANGLYLMAIYY
jgi:tRNA pseudouridine38-40 synthase